MTTVRLSDQDNVVTAIKPLEVGTDGAVQLIPRGHKMAISDIAEGTPVRKYAQIIGYASENIAKGAHVHTHNLEFRCVDTAYEFSTNLHLVAPASSKDTKSVAARSPSA